MTESDRPGYDPARDDPELTVNGDNTEELAETGYSPPDHEPRSLRFQTTEAETRRGETIDDRLAEEEPDGTESGADDEFAENVDTGPDRRAGRLVASDDADDAASGFDLAADDAGFAGYAASAEEAAVHVLDPDAE